MKTVTIKTQAWMTDYCKLSYEEIAEGQTFGIHYSEADMSVQGWTLVGEAEITVQLVERKALVENKVEALRAEAKNIRAEATARCTLIESQIQNLLAISYDEGAA